MDLATRWVAPKGNSKTEDAFLLYRNYDGTGAQVSGDSVRATSANVDAVGAYAIRGGAGGNTLYILLFNKDTAVQTAAVSVAGGLSQAARLYRFAVAARLAAAGTATPTAGSLTLTLPARTATLAVVALPAGAEPPPVATSFHTTAPCRILDTRNANGPLGGPALVAGVRRDFVLTGTCGVPPTAKSISANVTVTQPSVAGSLVAFPSDLAQAPLVNTLSLRAGGTRANNAILLLAHDGSGGVAFANDMSSGSAHLIVDVNGWWE